MEKAVRDLIDKLKLGMIPRATGGDVCPACNAPTYPLFEVEGLPTIWLPRACPLKGDDPDLCPNRSIVD